MVKVIIEHLNMLLLLGLALFGGTVGARIFKKFKIPQVVGYIAIGILLGQSGFNIISIKLVQSFAPFNYFALGLIGFMIGGELKREVFKKYGKQFFIILFFEGIFAFIFVSLFTGFLGSFLLRDYKLAWALGILLGAISSATAPAATTDVLWEYRTEGPLTRTVLGIVALDDALGLFLFAIASSIAFNLVGNTDTKNISLTFLKPVYEILGAIILGFIFGLILSTTLKVMKDPENMLAFSIGMVLITLGVSMALDVDIILSAMALGTTLVNIAPKKSKEIFELVKRFTPPIYVLFFVLVGAKLNISHLNQFTFLAVILYLFGRTFGKMLGANLGARLSNAPITVQKYLPLCLFSQAGVAIGLSIIASQKFPGLIGDTIVIIVTSTTFVVQLIGPIFVKIAVEKAGEVGLNITEEDIIKMSKASDVLSKNVPFILEKTPLNKIMEIISETENLYYPVVDKNGHLIGVITIEGIKNVLTLKDVEEIVLAIDIAEPVKYFVYEDTPLEEVMDILRKKALDFICVLDKKGKIKGIIETRDIQRYISTKMIYLKKKVEKLG
ncbi:sodium:proton exchanger [Candidatus Pacearchaeota archaeon]|nr:MAG: sodium:proton exchanger [Candidatus Pacearchaeota archaeon]